MRILIADDHPLYLNAVQVLLERLIDGISIELAKNLEQALTIIQANEIFDLLLLDYSMPGMRGAEGVKTVTAVAGGAPVVVMSGVACPADVGACIAAGARGFLPKTLDNRVFSSALTVILSGGSYLPVEMHQALYAPAVPAAVPVAQVSAPAEPADAALSDTVLPDTVLPDGGHGFTERERTIMAMIIEGRSNKEIARILDLREVTIKVQLTRIYKKLGAKNRAQAATIIAQADILA